MPHRRRDPYAVDESQSLPNLGLSEIPVPSLTLTTPPVLRAHQHHGAPTTVPLSVVPSLQDFVWKASSQLKMLNLSMNAMSAIPEDISLFSSLE